MDSDSDLDEAGGRGAARRQPEVTRRTNHDREAGAESEQDSVYASKVGARLRAIRRQKNYSLQHVEAISKDEFKASVLGAYERGERAISVPRLQRLARLYRVPVDQMLPADEPDSWSQGGEHVIDLTDSARAEHRNNRPVTIDLTAVEQLSGQEGEMIARYLRMIQVQRGDYNGRMLTIRRDDLRAVACVLDCHPDEVPLQLTRLGLSLVR